MIYLDYSATTPVNKEVLDDYLAFNLAYYGNPNSTHELGLLANHQIEKATKSIQKTLGFEGYEVIYTSGATEANNLALKGYARANQHLGRHIITSPYEHSSVTTVLNQLAKEGFEIDVVGLESSGRIDLSDLDRLIRSDTLLVSIAMVNSELGILQDQKGLMNVLRKHPGVCFHSDMTQMIGKQRIDLEGIDLVSFSAHKFYGLKGIGALLRKTHLNLEPVIHGGRSTSLFRGGTPPAPLIHSLAYALELAYRDFEKKLSHIKDIHQYLRAQLSENIRHAVINYKEAIPQILNVSFTDLDATTLHKELSKRQIYISTQTACHSDASFSTTVKRLTGSDRRAETSVRISLSHLTKKVEIDQLIDALKDILDENR